MFSSSCELLGSQHLAAYSSSLKLSSRTKANDIASLKLSRLLAITEHWQSQEW